MSIYTDKFFEDKQVGALWDVAVSIKRGKALPLDKDAVVHGEAELNALTSSPVSYPGQIVACVVDAVIENNIEISPEHIDIYYLDQNKIPQRVGTSSGSGLNIVNEEKYVQYINYDENDNIILEDGTTYYYLDGTGTNAEYKEFVYTEGSSLPIYTETDDIIGDTVNVFFIKKSVPTVQIENDINLNVNNLEQIKGLKFKDTGAEEDDGKFGPYDSRDRDIYVRGGTLQSTKNWDFNNRYIGHIHYHENDFKSGDLVDRDDYVVSTGLLRDYRVNPFNYSSIGMFPSIAVIGDSWACGSIYFGNDSIDGSYESISWPSILCARNNIKLFNYSRSGMEAESFVSGKYDSEGKSLNKALLDIDTYKPDLYIVALGYNQQNGSESFYNSLQTIYNSLHEKNPDAKWIMIKQPTTQENPALPTGIGYACKEISDYIGCPYIDSDEDKFFITSFYKDNLFTDNVSKHPIAATYAGIANAYDRLISKCIVDNVEYFKYFKSSNARGAIGSSGNIDVDLSNYATKSDLSKYVLINKTGDTYITTSGNFIVRKDDKNTPLYLAYIATPGDDATYFAANVDYVQKYFAKTKIAAEQLPSVAVRKDQNTVFSNKYVGGLNYTLNSASYSTYENQTNYAAPVGFVKEYVDKQLGDLESALEEI